MKYKNKGSNIYNNIYNKDEMMTAKCLANQALPQKNLKEIAGFCSCCNKNFCKLNQIYFKNCFLVCICTAD